MVIKIMAGITATYITLTYILSFIFRSSFMPMLYSAELASSLLKTMMVLSLVFIVYRSQFRYKIYQQATGWIGAFLVIFGFFGSFSVGLEFATYPYLMSMDYLIIAEVGILLCLASLTYHHQTEEMPRLLTNLTPPRQLAQLGLEHSHQLLNGFIDYTYHQPDRATSLSRRHSRLAS